MKIGNGRGRYRWSCRRESLVDFEWTKRIDKIYIWNTGNARESVKFIVGEGRFLKKIWSLKGGKHKSGTGIGEQTVIPISSVNLK